MSESEYHQVVTNVDFEKLNGAELIDAVRDAYEATHVIGMFSGGHDSLTAMHIASGVEGFSFACHINTGIGIEQTREFARATCKREGIPFREYRAEDYMGRDGDPQPQRFRDWVLRWGFPGAGQHSRMYQRLKERPLRHMIRDLDRTSKERTLLVTGMRAEESVRRMRHVHHVQEWEGTKVWVAPCWDWDKRQINEYIAEHELPRNEVSDNLHFSGECLCGAYAHPGELDEIAFFYPDAGDELKALQREVTAAGFPWGWEDGPPDWWQRHQDGAQFLPGLEPLCIGCANRDEGDDDESEAAK